MADITPDQARDALSQVDQARRQVSAEVGLPRAYWWAMAAGWIALGVIGALAPAWVTTLATLAFGAGHSTVAARLLDGRRPNRRLQVSRATADRRVPFIVIGILLVAVALTVGLALALDAAGAALPGIWSSVVVAAILGLGGPHVFAAIRRWIGA
ncbi:hypothetical protein AAFP30_16365 [Gordonia sp. CPCC 205515]|uniref:hypothetical protein n=1 Tax=Gordonia sp. CPCC 205515 TaxID=3140791 RepID=UPI003AF4047D